MAVSERRIGGHEASGHEQVRADDVGELGAQTAQLRTDRARELLQVEVLGSLGLVGLRGEARVQRLALGALLVTPGALVERASRPVVERMPAIPALAPRPVVERPPRSTVLVSAEATPVITAEGAIGAASIAAEAPAISSPVIPPEATTIISTLVGAVAARLTISLLKPAGPVVAPAGREGPIPRAARATALVAIPPVVPVAAAGRAAVTTIARPLVARPTFVAPLARPPVIGTPLATIATVRAPVAAIPVVGTAPTVLATTCRAAVPLDTRPIGGRAPVVPARICPVAALEARTIRLIAPRAVVPAIASIVPAALLTRRTPRIGRAEPATRPAGIALAPRAVGPLETVSPLGPASPVVVAPVTTGTAAVPALVTVAAREGPRAGARTTAEAPAATTSIRRAVAPAWPLEAAATSTPVTAVVFCHRPSLTASPHTRKT